MTKDKLDLLIKEDKHMKKNLLKVVLPVLSSAVLTATFAVPVYAEPIEITHHGEVLGTVDSVVDGVDYIDCEKAYDISDGVIKVYARTGSSIIVPEVSNYILLGTVNLPLTGNSSSSVSSSSTPAPTISEVHQTTPANVPVVSPAQPATTSDEAPTEPAKAPEEPVKASEEVSTQSDSDSTEVAPDTTKAKTVKKVSVKKGTTTAVKPTAKVKSEIKKLAKKYKGIKKVTYKSSNKKIATVSANGKIKALKKGKTTIIVKYYYNNGKTKSYKYTYTVK